MGSLLLWSCVQGSLLLTRTQTFSWITLGLQRYGSHLRLDCAGSYHPLSPTDLKIWRLKLDLELSNSFHMDVSSWIPPPPVPRKVLTYGLPNTSHHPQSLFDMGGSAQLHRPANLPAGPSQTGLGSRATGGGDQDDGMPASSAASGQHSQHTQHISTANTVSAITTCFRDHMGRLAMAVLGPEQMPASPNNSAPQSGGSSTRSTSQKTCSSTSPALAVNDTRAKITIQLYFNTRISVPGFQSEHGLNHINLWCRQLQNSMAFQYLKDQLKEHCRDVGAMPIVRIEAYETLPNHQVCSSIDSSSDLYAHSFSRPSLIIPSTNENIVVFKNAYCPLKNSCNTSKY